MTDEAAGGVFTEEPEGDGGEIGPIKFRSGRYRRAWVGNVVAVGNACGFVEPLEAATLMVLCGNVQTLTDFLLHSQRSPTVTMWWSCTTGCTGETWDDIQDFLALHYRFLIRG